MSRSPERGESIAKKLRLESVRQNSIGPTALLERQHRQVYPLDGIKTLKNMRGESKKKKRRPKKPAKGLLFAGDSGGREEAVRSLPSINGAKRVQGNEGDNGGAGVGHGEEGGGRGNNVGLCDEVFSLR